MNKGWDTATLKKLKALMGRGLSTAEIGKRLDMSKNAIVGKLNRLGWNKQAGGVSLEPASTKAAPVKQPPQKSAPVKKPQVKTAPVAIIKKPATTIKTAPVKSVKAAPAPVSAPRPESKKSRVNSDKSLVAHQRIMQHSLGMANLRSDQCRWPIGDPDSDAFHFCGEKVFLGKPYCYDHCKMAYQFTASKKKA